MRVNSCPKEFLSFQNLFYLLLLFIACSPKPEVIAQGSDQSNVSEPVTDAQLQLVAEGLTSPVALAEAPDGSGRLFVVDQTGLIRIIIKDGTLLEQPFLDLRPNVIELVKKHDERGLLGLAFHPNYEDNGRFFVYYNAPLRKEAPNGWDNTSHISEFQVLEDDPNSADPGSEKILLQVDQPQYNHNGGTLTFGPDGYLYISLGDGGGADDKDGGHVPDWYEKNEGGNGQDVEDNLLGSILRIDVDGDTPYGVPDDNPFVGREGHDEIFAFGLRNPYRFSFDMEGNHELIAGDAGQELWEEINVVTKGGNYGWNVKEATHCFNAANNKQPLDNCPDTDSRGNSLIEPVVELKTGGTEDGGQGLVIIGGYVYRGEAVPGFDGRYLFGVWTQHHEQPEGAMFVADRKEDGLWEFKELQVHKEGTVGLGHYVLGFGQDNDGEVYVLTTDRASPEGEAGKVYKLTSTSTKQ